MEAVPEFTPERAPVTTFSPRWAVGLMSGPERASDSEPSPERAPVDSPERAPVPEFRNVPSGRGKYCQTCVLSCVVVFCLVLPLT